MKKSYVIYNSELDGYFWGRMSGKLYFSDMKNAVHYSTEKWANEVMERLQKEVVPVLRVLPATE